jgi:hypothetical protein
VADAQLSIHANQAQRILDWNGLRVREDVLYSDAAGEESESRRKQAEKTLEKLKGDLPAILQPQETILFVMRCQSPVGAFEQLTLGWSVYAITACVLVFTNMRLLQFSVDSRGKWTRRLRSVRWGDITEASAKGLFSGVLTLRYADGKKEKYWRLRGKDKKKARALVAALLPASRSEASAAPGIVSLCPSCRTVLTPRVYQCGHCGQQFKDEKTLLWRVLIPGGAYFYAGATLLGIFSIWAEGILTLVVLLQFFLGLSIASRAAADPASPGRAAYLASAGFFAVLLILEKLMAYQHARRVIREFLPSKKRGQS